MKYSWRWWHGSKLPLYYDSQAIYLNFVEWGMQTPVTIVRFPPDVPQIAIESTINPFNCDSSTTMLAEIFFLRRKRPTCTQDPHHLSDKCQHHNVDWLSKSSKTSANSKDLKVKSDLMLTRTIYWQHLPSFSQPFHVKPTAIRDSIALPERVNALELGFL